MNDTIENDDAHSDSIVADDLSVNVEEGYIIQDNESESAMTSHSQIYMLDFDHDSLNDDLLNIDIDAMISDTASVRITHKPSIHKQDHIRLRSQHITKTSYLTLDILTTFIINVFICSQIFVVSLITYNVSEDDQVSSIVHYMNYFTSKVITMIIIGFITYIFTSSATYKSINGTLIYLLINAIVFEYDFIQIIKYLLIQFATGIVAALFTTICFYNFVSHIPVSFILNIVLTTYNNLHLSISYILVSILAHTALAIGITLITNNISSSNAKHICMHKSQMLCFISILFGAAIGPIETIWTHLSLYVIIVVIRNGYEYFNATIFSLHLTTMIITIIAYPLISIQVKFTWYNRYRRYIEYNGL